MSEADKCYKELRRMVIDAKRSWEIWNALSTVEHTTHSHALVFTSFAPFFHSVATSSLALVFLNLYAVFDKDERQHTFPNLIPSMKAEGYTFDFQGKYETTFKTIEPAWKKIGLMRNLYFAHKSKKGDYSTTLNRVNITIEEIQSVLSMTIELLNYFCVAFGKLKISASSIETTVENSVTRMLEVLQNDIENNRNR